MELCWSRWWRHRNESWAWLSPATPL